MQEITSVSQILTIEEFVEKFGSRSFLYQLIDKGVLKFHYLGAKPYLFLHEIVAAMKERPKEV